MLLIRTTGVSNRVPKILASIEARFNTACRIEEHDRDIRMETLTVVSCRLKDSEIKRYFLYTIEFLTSTPCPNPTVSAVAEMVDRRMDLFQQP